MKSILSKRGCLHLVWLLCWIASLFHLVYAEAIRIGGSDLLEEVLSDECRAFSHENGGVECDFSGSRMAVQALQSHTLDMGIVALPDATYVPDDAELRRLPFAYQVPVIVVHQSNPIEKLSLDQLADVLVEEVETQMPHWGDLGLSGRWGWGLREIRLFAVSNLSTAAFQLLRYTVLKNAAITHNLTILPDAESLYAQLLGDTLALGILPGPPRQPKVKVLSIATDTDSYAFDPSESNVFYGDYPLRLPFYLVFQAKAQPRLKALLIRLLSPEITERLREHDFVPLPEGIRQELILTLDGKA